MWYSHQFNDKHNHKLIANNHTIYEFDKALIDSKVAHGIKPYHIMRYIIGFWVVRGILDFRVRHFIKTYVG